MTDGNPRQKAEAEQPEPTEIKKVKRGIRNEVSSVVDYVEKDKVNEHPLGKSDLDEELEDSVSDVANESSFTEEKDEANEIAPIENAGTSETTREAVDERFSKEHDPETELLRKNRQRNSGSGS